MYLGFQGLRACAQTLPLRAVRLVGATLGLTAYGFLRGQRRLTQTHLVHAFGETLSPAERRRIARRVFWNLGQSALEWLWLPRLSCDELKRLVTSEGVEHLRRAIANGKGAIIITAHFGNWEIIPLYLRSLGFEGGVLARRLRYPEYESFLISLRGAKGVPTFTRGSFKEVATLLRANQIIGILPDQDMDSLEGVFVNFFGHPSYTPVGPAALSLLTGAPLLPCFLIREGERFRLVIEPPIPMPQTTDRTQALVMLTQAWSHVVESYIRRYPDHWVWMHRRWKTQPELTRDKGQATTSEQRPIAVKAPQSPPNLQPQDQAFTPLFIACCLSLVAVGGGCAKSAGPTATSSSPVDANSSATQADQQMSSFTLTGYEVDGTKRWELEGTGASIERDIVTIHHPDGIGYDLSRTAYLTASAAQVNQKNRHVRLEHDVTIHTSDGLWLTTPILHWIPDQNQFATDHPVRLETDHMLLRGRGARGLTQLKHATIFEDIELVLNPSDREALVGGDKHVTITCDGPLSFDYENNIATFEQNVHVQDPNGDLYSDKLIAYLNQEAHTIRYAEAIGSVRIIQQRHTAHSERAIYEPAAGKITLVGKPSLIVYPSEKGESPTLSFGGLSGTPAGGSSTPHGEVR